MVCAFTLQSYKTECLHLEGSTTTTYIAENVFKFSVANHSQRFLKLFYVVVKGETHKVNILSSISQMQHTKIRQVRKLGSNSS